LRQSPQRQATLPDEGSEALRDLVRAREAAKQDQLRARHRLTKFLLRTGRRSPLGVKAWTERYVEWLQQIHYTQPAQEATLLDCLNEVQHMGERVKRLEQSIVEVVKLAPAPMQEVIRGLQALRGVAHISAVAIAAELGNITSRFESARALMGYSGVFPSEDSSGKRIRKGGITKAGNAHLRRIVVESAWSYRHRPAIGIRLRRRQEGVPAEINEIAWKAQNRLHRRYMTLLARGKEQRKTMTAIARELLGFIWAIGIKAEAACRQQLAA
jgi:transposase